jgi:ankyrin repeat protein
MTPFTSTPLHEAIYEDDIEAIRSLLVNGANPNAPNELGRPPLVCTSNKDIIGLLLAHGADPNKTDSANRTPLDVAVSSVTQEEVIELLMKAGADPNKVGHMGFSTFTYACLNGEIDIVSAMIRCGADVNRADSQGLTPLQAAKRRPDVQLLLREAGAKG